VLVNWRNYGLFIVNVILGVIFGACSCAGSE
jgi:hypothetical protein